MIEKRIFSQEVIALSVLSFVLGFKSVDFLLFVFSELNISKTSTICSLCQVCKEGNFRYVNPSCKHILSCEACLPRLRNKCPKCKSRLDHPLTKLYF